VTSVTFVFVAALYAQAETNPVVTLRSAEAPAGESAFLSLNLSAVPNTEIAGLELEVEFPKNALSFIEVQPGSPDRARTQNIRVSTLGEENEEVSGLRVTITGQPVLSTGIVAYLVFQLPSYAQLGTNVVVKGRRIILTTSDGREIEKLIPTMAEIKVSESPLVFGCFFYMH